MNRSLDDEYAPTSKNRRGDYNCQSHRASVRRTRDDGSVGKIEEQLFLCT